MTYGERLARAMDHANVGQTALARRVADLIRDEGLETKISQQNVQRALVSDKSVYTSWFAIALGVNLQWLENGIGDMVVPAAKNHTDWPFDFELARYLRLPPSKKQAISNVVLSMIESFEEEIGAQPQKKTLRRRK